MKVKMNVGKDVSAYSQIEIDAPDALFALNDEGVLDIADVSEFKKWASELAEIKNAEFEVEWEYEFGLRITGVDLDGGARMDIDIPLSPDHMSAGMTLLEISKMKFGSDLPIAEIESRVYARFTEACNYLGITDEEQDAIVRALASHHKRHAERATKTKVVVVMNGGTCESIHASDPDAVDVDVVDLDVDGMDEEEIGLIRYRSGDTDECAILSVAASDEGIESVVAAEDVGK